MVIHNSDRPLLMIELDGIWTLYVYIIDFIITAGKDSAILWFSFRSLEINLLKVTLLIYSQTCQIFGHFGVLRKKIGKYFITIDSKLSKTSKKNVSKNGVCYCPCLKKGRTKTGTYAFIAELQRAPDIIIYYYQSPTDL